MDWDAKAGRLSLAFTLPLAEPMALGADGAQIDIYDPTYFVAYAFDEKDAVTLGGRRPRPASGPTASPGTGLEDHAAVAAIPADPDALPEELFAITKGLTHRIEVRCP